MSRSASAFQFHNVIVPVTRQPIFGLTGFSEVDPLQQVQQVTTSLSLSVSMLCNPRNAALLWEGETLVSHIDRRGSAFQILSSWTKRALQTF